MISKIQSFCDVIYTQGFWRAAASLAWCRTGSCTAWCPAANPRALLTEHSALGISLLFSLSGCMRVYRALLFAHFHPLLFFVSKCITVWPPLCSFQLVGWKSLGKGDKVLLLSEWRGLKGSGGLHCLGKRKWWGVQLLCCLCLLSWVNCYFPRTGFTSIKIS